MGDWRVPDPSPFSRHDFGDIALVHARNEAVRPKIPARDPKRLGDLKVPYLLLQITRPIGGLDVDTRRRSSLHIAGHQLEAIGGNDEVQVARLAAEGAIALRDLQFLRSYNLESDTTAVTTPGVNNHSSSLVQVIGRRAP